MADQIKTFGTTKIIDTGSVTKIECDGTVRFVIDHTSGDITAGAVAGTGAGLIMAGEVNVAATTGVSEKFYVEGNSQLTGYLTMSGGAGTYFKAPTLTTTQRDALTPAAGMVVYNSTASKLQCYAGGVWNDLF